MERELFSIEQSARGWVVYTANGGNEPPDPTPLVALEHAEQLASARHRSKGRPTGAKVKLRCGDTVLVACHGCWRGRRVSAPASPQAGPSYEARRVGNESVSTCKYRWAP